MKITTQHTAAIARHIADVLGDADTSRAEVALTAIIGEGATYTDLPVVDVMVVTEGLRDAVVSVPAIRRGTITALFTHVREGAPTCKRCGRLRLQLAGSTWQAVTASTCPVDAGLYEVAAVPVVIGWHDGREYPDGTTHDGEGVPLTEAAIRAERKVDASITAACEETGATLLDVLAAMPGATPAEALAAIVDPSRKWVSDRALRAFVRDAKGALTRRTGGAPPPPFAAGVDVPSGAVDLRALRDALATLYPTDALIRRVAWDAGVSVGGVDLAGSSVTQWFNIIEEAVKTGHIGALLAVATREYPRSPALRALAAPPAGDPINWQRLTGPQYKALQDALTSAFPSRAKIEQLVSFGLDERLDMIASGGTLGALAFEVIQWTQARGHTRRLFDEARRQNPGNPALIALAARA